MCLKRTILLVVPLAFTSCLYTSTSSAATPTAFKGQPDFVLKNSEPGKRTAYFGHRNFRYDSSGLIGAGTDYKVFAKAAFDRNRPAKSHMEMNLTLSPSSDLSPQLYFEEYPADGRRLKWAINHLFYPQLTDSSFVSFEAHNGATRLTLPTGEQAALSPDGIFATSIDVGKRPNVMRGSDISSDIQYFGKGLLVTTKTDLDTRTVVVNTTYNKKSQACSVPKSQLSSTPNGGTQLAVRDGEELLALVRQACGLDLTKDSFNRLRSDFATHENTIRSHVKTTYALAPQGNWQHIGAKNGAVAKVRTRLKFYGTLAPEVDNRATRKVATRPPAPSPKPSVVANKEPRKSESGSDSETESGGWISNVLSWIPIKFGSDASPTETSDVSDESDSAEDSR